jgi:hypothetical protein
MNSKSHAPVGMEAVALLAEATLENHSRSIEDAVRDHLQTARLEQDVRTSSYLLIGAAVGDAH